MSTKLLAPAPDIWVPVKCFSSIPGNRKHSVLGALLAASVLLTTQLAYSAERNGESIVTEVCAACHRTGEKGAPKIGDKSQWSKRGAQGLTVLSQHALEGIRNMPAHGGNAGLSRFDLERAITYMVNQSGGKWTEPIAKAPARTGEALVKAKCTECHQTGKYGAPRIGDRDAWTSRVSRGLEAVIASGVHGRGAMPARGGMPDLSDAEMRAAVVYMFRESVAGKSQ